MRVLNSGMFEVRVHLGVRYIWRDNVGDSLRFSGYVAWRCGLSCAVFSREWGWVYFSMRSV